VFNLLSTNQAKLLAAHLGLPTTASPHNSLREASDSLSSQQLATVLAFFGADDVGGAVGYTGVTKREARPHYDLFKHQRSVLRRAQERLYRGARRVVLHMPTGAGKTRVAMNVVSEHLRDFEPTVVVWLAFSAELLEQAASEFETAWRYLGNRKVEIVRFWGASSVNLAAVSDGVIVAGLGKLFAAGRSEINLLPTLGDAVSLVVMDEAHQSIAETYEFVLDILATKRRDASLLGLTATPGRTYSDINEDARLAKFWTGEKVRLEVEGYDNPVKYLIAEGYLAKPEFRTVLVNSGCILSEEDLRRVQSGLDLPDNTLELLAGDDKWNAAVIETTRELMSRHRRVLVFATNVRQAIVLASVMRALGHNARTVIGTTPKPERQSVLQQYTSNTLEPMAVFNYGVLTTGFDAPATSAAVIARPTRSLVLFSQMVGRALRGTQAGGNERAEIVTVIDTKLPGFGDPATAFTNWEDVW
jgi:superfamily II DNA or RNA helicase